MSSSTAWAATWAVPLLPAISNPESGLIARAVPLLTMDNQPHACMDQVPVGLVGDRNLLRRQVRMNLVRLIVTRRAWSAYNRRGMWRAAIGKRCDGIGELNRSDHVETLPDSGNDRFTGVPGFCELAASSIRVTATRPNFLPTGPGPWVCRNRTDRDNRASGRCPYRKASW